MDACRTEAEESLTRLVNAVIKLTFAVKGVDTVLERLRTVRHHILVFGVF